MKIILTLYFLFLSKTCHDFITKKIKIKYIELIINVHNKCPIIEGYRLIEEIIIIIIIIKHYRFYMVGKINIGRQDD